MANIKKLQQNKRSEPKILHTIVFLPNGTAKMPYNESIPLSERLGTVLQRKRASHVEPVENSDKWYVSLTPYTGKPNDILGTYNTHSEALSAEQAWLHDNLE